MSILMPFAKRFEIIGGMLFPALSIALYDVITLKFGVWTLITALAYGFVGLLAAHYFNTHEPSLKEYLKFTIWATLMYDLMTGVLAGPAFFGQSFSEALAGQIPFTIYHLIGAIGFVLLLTPVVEWFLAWEPAIINIHEIEGGKTSAGF
jgi:uncharacterized membrane protein YuzA (DUF378 family)